MRLTILTNRFLCQAAVFFPVFFQRTLRAKARLRLMAARFFGEVALPPLRPISEAVISRLMARD